MNEKLTQAQDIILDRINYICGRFGLNNIMAQLYAILYLSDETMSLDEMAERLKISKGSVSINIRALERYGAARKVWIKGSRKDYYEAEDDIVKVILDRARSMAKNRLSEVDAMVSASEQALSSIDVSSEEEKQSTEVFKKRMTKLKELYDKAQTLFNLLNSKLLINILQANALGSKKEDSLTDKIKI
jgi:DNA-binding transcriptional regulator GbsR (MarR family)